MTSTWTKPARAVAAGAALVLAAVGVAHGQSAFELSGKVKEVVDRSKTASGVYSLYEWGRITRDGQPPVEFWSAEFNQGQLHRVETPNDRVIADCTALTGEALSLATGKTASGAGVAATACGISTLAMFVKAESLGEVDTPFGKADRVRLYDGQLIRTYDVDRQGVIVSTVFQRDVAGQPVVLSGGAVAILPQLPAQEMFDEASLQKSFVPDQYKSPPKPKG